jgi:hypothetical protein
VTGIYTFVNRRLMILRAKGAHIGDQVAYNRSFEGECSSLTIVISLSSSLNDKYHNTTGNVSALYPFDCTSYSFHSTDGW